MSVLNLVSGFAVNAGIAWIGYGRAIFQKANFAATAGQVLGGLAATAALAPVLSANNPKLANDMMIIQASTGLGGAFLYKVALPEATITEAVVVGATFSIVGVLITDAFSGVISGAEKNKF